MEQQKGNDSAATSRLFESAALASAVDSLMSGLEKPLVDLAMAAYVEGVKEGAKAAIKIDQLMFEMLAALEGVIRVADRSTVEFDAARAVVAKAKQIQAARQEGGAA